jgi:hypothetical protein
MWAILEALASAAIANQRPAWLRIVDASSGKRKADWPENLLR